MLLNLCCGGCRDTWGSKGAMDCIAARHIETILNQWHSGSELRAGTALAQWGIRGSEFIG